MAPATVHRQPTANTFSWSIALVSPSSTVLRKIQAQLSDVSCKLLAGGNFVGELDLAALPNFYPKFRLFGAFTSRMNKS